MPRRKYCQHPTRHAMSASAAEGSRPVSLKLSMVLTSRYDINDTRIRWLCPRCYTFESNEMKIHHPMQAYNNRSSSDHEFSAENDAASDDDDDDETDDKVSCDTEEYEDNNYINDDLRTMTKDNGEETNVESMDEGPGDVPCDLEYHQNEAMEKLSTTFRLLNMDPIHDK